MHRTHAAVRPVRSAALAASLLSSFLPNVTRAQASFDPQHFRPAPHAEGFLSTESGALPERFDLRIGLYANYGYHMLQTVDAARGRRAGILDHRLDAQLFIALSSWSRLSLALELPLTLYQEGQLRGVPLTHTAAGDARVSAKLGVLKQRAQLVDLALALAIGIPTGAEAAFLGERLVSASAELDLSRRLGPVRLGVNAGFFWRPPTFLSDVRIGPELYYRAAMGLDLARLGAKAAVELLVELYGKTAATSPFRNEAQNPLEAVLGVRWAVTRSLTLDAGVGRGLLPGYGVPAARAFLGLAWRPFAQKEEAERATEKAPSVACPAVVAAAAACSIHDHDGDGIVDEADLCPADPGPVTNTGCPAADSDGDGVLDAQDQCPSDAEDIDGFQDEDGCKDPDNDGDGILDAQDKCPLKAETINGVDDTDGCPDAGKSLVVVRGDRIELLDKVYFASGDARILPRSFAVLGQVAAVLKNHAEIGRLRVEGHTDADGDGAKNLALSQRRAEAVVEWLIAHGTEAARLEAVGYGATQPLAANATKKGKEQNRRVVFAVVPTKN